MPYLTDCICNKYIDGSYRVTSIYDFQSEDDYFRADLGLFRPSSRVFIAQEVASRDKIARIWGGNVSIISTNDHVW